MGKHTNPRLEWDKVIPMATAAYNFFPRTTSKERPFFLMFGRDPLTGLEKLLGDTVNYFRENGGRLDLTVLQNTYQLAGQNVQKAREKAEGKEPSVPSIFQSGDLANGLFLLYFVLAVCWFSCSFVSEACAGFGEWL